MASEKKPLVYYCLAGVGQGNASRLEALWQELEGRISLRIFCWGNSYKYLCKKLKQSSDVEIIQMKQYRLAHAGGALNTWKTFLNLPRLLCNYGLNSFLLIKELSFERPSLSIHDSDYHLFPFIVFGVKRVVVSQAPMIVANKELLKKYDLKTRLNFFLYEYSEYLFIRMAASLILCPSFDLKLKSNVAMLEVIRPIVRREFNVVHDGVPEGIVVATGASGIGGEEFVAIARTYHAGEMIARNGKQYEAIDAEGRPVLSFYKGAIIQAGHVLISECLSLAIPFYPVAISAHPEQIVNKEIIARDYYPRVAGKVEGFIAYLNESSNVRKRLDCSGAREGAQIILNLLTRKTYCFTADDWGMSKEINEAIFELAKENKVRKISIMVNQDFSTYLLEEVLQTKVDFSLHFNLTEGRPLSSPASVSTLVDRDGNFFGIGIFIYRFFTLRINYKEMILELRKQLERANELVGDRLKELDGHHHIHLIPGFISRALNEIEKLQCLKIRCPQDRGHLGSYLGGVLLKRVAKKWPSIGLISYGYLNLSSRTFLKFKNVIFHPGLKPTCKTHWGKRRYQEYQFLKEFDV